MLLLIGYVFTHNPIVPLIKVVFNVVTTIKAGRNELSYVKIAITDAAGNIILDADITVRLSVSGDGEIAGSGSASPNDMESVNSPLCRTYREQALAILRPLKNHKQGMIKLKAEVNGLAMDELKVTLK